MSNALQLVSSLLEDGPDDIDPEAYIRDLPPREPRIAYALLPSEMANPSITTVTPIMVKEGESGYWPTNWKWRKQFAEQALANMNAKLGLTPEEADAIFTQSLFRRPPTKRKLKEADPDEFRPKDLLLQVPSPYKSLISEIKPGDGMTAPMRVVLKRSLRRGEWVTRLENVQSGGEFWGHYHENYDTARMDFEDRCIRLGVSTIPFRHYTEETMARRLVSTLLTEENDPDVVDPARYLKDLPGPDRRIRVSFSRTTPESAAEGDTSDHGWIDEEGVDMTPDLYDLDDGMTAVDKAVAFLHREGATQASASFFHEGIWYSSGYHPIDYRTGEDEERCFHLSGFTPEEEAEIYKRTIGRRH